MNETYEYCEKCKKKVIPSGGKCPICGTSLCSKNDSSDNLEDEARKQDDDMSVITSMMFSSML